VLGQILAAVTTHKPGLVIIAGDIYDRPTVAQSVVAQFNNFVRSLAHDSDAALVMISGNHDASERIEAMGLWPDLDRVSIRGTAVANEQPLILHDEFGPVAITGLPYLEEYKAREIFEDPTISSPEDILRAQFENAKESVPQGARWVVCAHTFVAGAVTTEIEKPLSSVGGIDAVPGAVFEEANYVALGHLHKPQSMYKKHIRYSGAPLALGFDEAGAQKSLTLVELDAHGDIDIQEIPITPLRHLQVIRGTLAELLVNGAGNEDFYRIILTDKENQIDPAKRLREVYPNFCSLEYAKDEIGPGEITGVPEMDAELPKPEIVIDAFLKQVRDQDVSSEETHLINHYLTAIDAEEKFV
jgi:exonuclease SbcD